MIGSEVVKDETTREVLEMRQEMAEDINKKMKQYKALGDLLDRVRYLEEEKKRYERDREEIM